MLSKLAWFLNQPKKRSFAITLALLGTIIPQLAGVHKFYLGQPLWGIIYLLLGWQTPSAQVACAIELIWYLAQDREQFDLRFNSEGGELLPQSPAKPQQVGAIATAVRELDKLREDGLITEGEFEQKRRKLLDSIS